MFYNQVKMLMILLASITALSACNQPSVKLNTLVLPSKTIINPFTDSGIANVSFLFVLDTSGSMDTINKQLANNFKHLLALLKDFPYYNYNFAIASMSPYVQFKTNPVLFNLLPDYLEKFCTSKDQKNIIDPMIKSTTHLGNYFEFNQKQFSAGQFSNLSCVLSQNFAHVQGYDGGTESYFGSMNYLMDEKDNVFYKKFFSRDNFLVIIFVSDAIGVFMEDPEYDKIHLLNLGKEYGKEQFKKIYSIKKDNRIRAYGVLPDKLGTCGESKASQIAYPVHAYSFIEESKGKVFSVCEDGWGDNLSVISEDLKESFTNQSFELDEIPLVETIEIYFNDHKIPNDIKKGWYYNPETLTIHISENFNLRDHMKDQKDNNYTIKYHPLNQSILDQE